ncbi:hypothetical protein FA13DRAFT_1730316 [Coprinellus micaceus]|uniref:Uncharacterized protein n=1 Tax=Coprinellus micaceus TaxID=71717 RepID=A0A4Y7TJ40_COPMI|nr:hypothetical protein FA13DRAFT_1730316 [Coprinellus micaceus]
MDGADTGGPSPPKQPLKTATPSVVGPRPSAAHHESSSATLSFNPYDEVSNTSAAKTARKLQPNRHEHVEDAQDRHVHEAHGNHDLKPYKPLGVLRLRLWLATCVAFTILAPLVSIIMGVTLHARDMRYPGDEGLDVFPGRTIDFEVVLISADPKAGQMRMDWKILGEENSPCRADNLPGMNLLRAEGTHSTQEEILTSDRPTRPIFKFNATAFVIQDKFSRTPTFRTQLALFSPDRTDSSLLFYPFDAYAAEIIFYAREAGTNDTVGVTDLEVQRDCGVCRAPSPIAFSVLTHHSCSAASKLTFAHTYNTVPAGLVEATITLTRSTLVKSYSIVSTMAVWVITLILALVMITTVFFGFKQRGEVLVIPVATLFAFTQLRQSMPGAPDGFGDIVDLVGLVPCLAILALTAAFSLAAFILTDPTDMPRRIRWKVIPYVPTVFWLMHDDAFPSLKPEKDVENKHQGQKPSSH